STWDQNAASNLTAPAEAVVEEICADWAKALLGIPKSASFAFVTGCQMAHTTALASARHKLLRDRGWDVEKLGLGGAPQVRILTTENRHESIMRSVYRKDGRWRKFLLSGQYRASTPYPRHARGDPRRLLSRL